MFREYRIKRREKKIGTKDGDFPASPRYEPAIVY